MKPITPDSLINKFRQTSGMNASTRFDGQNGSFRIPLGPKKMAYIIVSNELGWEHVSAHVSYLITRGKKPKSKQRTPTWSEMCQIKEFFWEDEETVIQFHPAKSEYVNNHPHCLHLWRSTEHDQATPPSELVGIKKGQTVADFLQVADEMVTKAELEKRKAEARLGEGQSVIFQLDAAGTCHLRIEPNADPEYVEILKDAIAQAAHQTSRKIITLS